MPFQNYLNAVESKTGLTPRELLQQAYEKGFRQDTETEQITAWLKDQYGLRVGDSMAIVHLITAGTLINTKRSTHTGMAADRTDKLWLDGKDSMPTNWGQ